MVSSDRSAAVGAVAVVVFAAAVGDAAERQLGVVHRCWKVV